MARGSKYCFDTSAILDGWVRHYPPDVFPSFWKHLGRLVKEGRVISPEEVREELSEKEDSVYHWAKQQTSLFLPLDEAIQIATAEILEVFPKLVKALSRRNRADPFVIALAKVSEAAVVTAELHRGTAERPRIPLVCAHFGIRYTNLVGFMREVGWKF